jgi:hypothetical protein
MNSTLPEIRPWTSKAASSFKRSPARSDNVSPPKQALRTIPKSRSTERPRRLAFDARRGFDREQ